jgi:hypothetical protein
MGPDDDDGDSALVVAFAAGGDEDGKVRGMPHICDSVVFTLESLGLHIAAFCSGVN